MMDCIQGKNELIGACEGQNAQGDGDQVGHGHLRDGRGYPFLPLHENISSLRLESSCLDEGWHYLHFKSDDESGLDEKGGT